MDVNRRQLLKAAGLSVGAGGVVAASTTAAAAEEPVDQWRPADSSNYSASNRGVNDINWIVIHYTVGSYGGAINWFQNPDANVSAHYVVRNSDGHTTKMVDESDVAWHAAGFNSNSIGIEHEWVEGQDGFTDALYQRSAAIIDYLAETYDIPKNYYTSHTAPCNASGGIIGHMHTPTDSYCSSSNSTSCPGPYDPDKLQQYLGDGDGGDGTFEMDQAVHTTADLNAREQPGTDSPIVATMPEGSAGRVVNGPESADGYTWWGLHFHAENVWAWCAEPWLEACPTFCHGTYVESTGDLNVRSGPSVNDTVRSTVPEGTRGVVTQGPQNADGYQWWYVEWNDGSEGWSVVDYLQTA
ncbi:N-acetylmuramoyl-L-alanine amidase [Natrialbaceae archaeon A-CW1-1]